MSRDWKDIGSDQNEVVEEELFATFASFSSRLLVVTLSISIAEFDTELIREIEALVGVRRAVLVGGKILRVSLRHRSTSKTELARAIDAKIADVTGYRLTSDWSRLL